MIPQVVIIGDFLKDLDDEHALCLAAYLHKQGLIQLLCVIANLKPASVRARGAKGTLKLLGLPYVPVGIGMDVCGTVTHPYELDIPYLAGLHEVTFDGPALLQQTLEVAADQSVVLVLQSGFTDAAALLATRPGLCLRKISHVAIMGGVVTADGAVCLDEGGFLVPDNANNNMFDWPAALAVYTQLQKLGIPFVVTTKKAAYACQVPRSMYNLMTETGNPIGPCLTRRQVPAIESWWQAACAPPGSEVRGILPPDRNRRWFIDVYCGGRDPGIPDYAPIWEYVQGLNLYDPINLVAAVPKLLAQFFEPTEVVVTGTTQRVIGVSKEKHGIKNPAALRDFIINGELSSLVL